MADDITTYLRSFVRIQTSARRRWRCLDRYDAGFDRVRTVLDVGCGAGHWGQRLGTVLAEGATIVGDDHEDGFLEAARARAQGRPHHFEYRRGDAEALPFLDDHFDH